MNTKQNAGKSYNTRQKDLILEYLEQNCGKCKSIREISAELYNSGVKIGETTLYRAMSSLEESGAVKKYIGADGEGALWQYVGEDSECHAHFHLKCLSCGEIEHLDCDFMREIEKHISEEHDFEVDDGKTVFYGLCAKCRKKEKEKSAVTNETAEINK